MRRLKTAAAALALVLILTGCTGATVTTLHDTDTLHVERKGNITRIVDRAGGDTYTLKTVRRHGTAAQISEATTTADTDTLLLQTVGGLIIVTDKTTGTTLYIKGARK